MKEINKDILQGEVWKNIELNFEYINNRRLEISNYGRLRSFSSLSNGRFLKPHFINGYKIVMITFFINRDKKDQIVLDLLKEQLAEQIKKIGKINNKLKAIQDEAYNSLQEDFEKESDLLDKMKIKFQKKFKSLEKKRTIRKGYLLHRLVAEYFVEQPSPEHCKVAHLDFNKQNNQVYNLKWMTTLAVARHQKNNPNVIEALEKRRNGQRNEKTKVYKLTTPKVMLIKKKIREGVSLRSLSRTFKVTETQLLRIKRGENWGHVEAAI